MVVDIQSFCQKRINASLFPFRLGSLMEMAYRGQATRKGFDGFHASSVNAPGD